MGLFSGVRTTLESAATEKRRFAAVDQYFNGSQQHSIRGLLLRVWTAFHVETSVCVCVCVSVCVCVYVCISVCALAVLLLKCFKIFNITIKCTASTCKNLLNTTHIVPSLKHLILGLLVLEKSELNLLLGVLKHKKVYPCKGK